MIKIGIKVKGFTGFGRVIDPRLNSDFVTVLWDNSDYPSDVLIDNLEVVLRTFICEYCGTYAAKYSRCNECEVDD